MLIVEETVDDEGGIHEVVNFSCGLLKGILVTCTSGIGGGLLLDTEVLFWPL